MGFFSALIGPAIGAVSSLIGGSKNRKAQAAANAANSPVGQVKQWEAAGINPAFGISSGGYIPQKATSMGDSFAQAGAIFGEGLARNHENQLRETETKKENQKLRKELDKIAKGSGPSEFQRYGSVLPLPSQGQISGSGLVPKPNASTVLPTGGFGAGTVNTGGPEVERNLGVTNTESVAPGRNYEVLPLGNSPGVFEMNSNLTMGLPIILPGEGEVSGMDEAGLAYILGAPQLGWQLGRQAGKKRTERNKAAGKSPHVVDINLDKWFENIKTPRSSGSNPRTGIKY